MKTIITYRSGESGYHKGFEAAQRANDNPFSSSLVRIQSSRHIKGERFAPFSFKNASHVNVSSLKCLQLMQMGCLST